MKTSKRSSWGDRKFEYYRQGNLDAELQAERTGTSKYSPYQLQTSCRGAIATDDSEDERHAGATQDFLISDNEPNKDHKKVLLVELWEQLHSCE